MMMNVVLVLTLALKFVTTLKEVIPVAAILATSWQVIKQLVKVSRNTVWINLASTY